MHAVVCAYTGPNAAQFIDALERRKADVERLASAIDGFVSYLLVRTGEGGTSVSVYQTKSGADESSRRTADFVENTMSADLRVTPACNAGEVVAQADAQR
jgi:hypothetical protein